MPKPTTQSDNAIFSGTKSPHVRLLLGMKYGPTVHAKACDDPEFKAKHDAAIDAAVAALEVAAAPAGAQWAVAYRLTMRSGVSGRNDNVVGDFNDYQTAFFVGGLMKDADSRNHPEYRSFDVEPTHPPAASEDAVDAARYRWLREHAAAGSGHPFICVCTLGGFSQWTGDAADRRVDAARDGEGVGGG